MAGFERSNAPYTSEEVEFIKANFGTMTVAEISERLQRTPNAIARFAENMGLRKGPYKPDTTPQSKARHKAAYIGYFEELIPLCERMVELLEKISAEIDVDGAGVSDEISRIAGRVDAIGTKPKTPSKGTYQKVEPYTREQIESLGAIIDTRDVAGITGLALNSVRRMAKEGRIPVVKVGGKYKYSKEKILCHFNLIEYLIDVD